jgi:hypothetical protein
MLGIMLGITYFYLDCKNTKRTNESIFLIGIGKTAHTREDTENVVIHGVYADDTSDAR